MNPNGISSPRVRSSPRSTPKTPRARSPMEQDPEERWVDLNVQFDEHIGYDPASKAKIRILGISSDRLFALIAVCTMSIGSHFAMYQLGPLKSRLHDDLSTSNAQFSLLIAAFNLNSTWTPLVAGFFVTRYGTSLSSLLTTSCIFIGQLILYLGFLFSNIIIMTFGLFIFGLGVTPLSVVQETLLSQLSPAKNIGISLALGLVSGKTSSFISSLVSLPLANTFGDSAPFAVSVIFCGFSFMGNGARLYYGWGRDAVMEGEGHVKKNVKWGGVGRLGDVYWVYILLNFFAGMIWSPFLHLSANLVKEIYDLSESFAATQAAILLSGALILYPITGFITDKLSPNTPRTTLLLLVTSSALTLSGYTYLSVPLSDTPVGGMILFTSGHGMATLLLVILVPRFLPLELVPLGLGLHKSMEMASSTMSQTLSGIWLDITKQEEILSSHPSSDGMGGSGEVGNKRGSQALIRCFWLINLLQLCVGIWLFALEAKRRHAGCADQEEHEGLMDGEEYERLPLNDLPPLDSDDEHYKEEDESEDEGLKKFVRPSSGGKRPRMQAEGSSNAGEPSMKSALAQSNEERGRSKVFLCGFLGWVCLVWIVFIVDAFRDLV